MIDKIEDTLDRENAQKKLAHVVEFCQLQGCRRKYLLEYFGEKWEGGNCGGCDFCLTPKEAFDATEISQKILSAVIRTGQRFGVRHVTDLLQGTRTKKVRSLGHDQLSVFGIARDFRTDELNDFVDHLLTRGLLAKLGSRYPTLAVTEAGRMFLKRKDTLVIDKLKRTPEDNLPSWTKHIEYDQVLFEKLRALRMKLADDRYVPAFVIFGNTSLRQMASSLPQSRDSFARIHGVGTEKLAQFSEEFLAVIRDHAQQRGMPEGTISGRRNRRDPPASHGDSTLEQTRKLLTQGLSLSEVARRRGLTIGTILGHLEQLAAAGNKLDLGHLMPPPDRLAKIRAALQLSDDGQLSPIRELLGQDFSYAELRLVRLGWRQEKGMQGEG